MPDSPNHLNAATSVAASLLLVCGIAVCAHASVQDADPAPSAPSAEPAPSAESAEPAEEALRAAPSAVARRTIDFVCAFALCL